MKKLLVISALVGAIMIPAVQSEAQATDNNWVEVRATVVGIFDFTVNGTDATTVGVAQVHDFGNVSATGINGGVVDAAAGSATYTAPAAFTWAVESAPSRTVDISYTTSTNKSQGDMAIDQLSMEMTVTQSTGTSQGMTALSTAKTLLVDDGAAGNGNNTLGGNINLELTVDSDDTPEFNEWEIELLAEQV